MFVCVLWGCFRTSLIFVLFSQHHLMKRLSFLRCVFFPPLSKTNWLWVCGFASGLSILPRVSFCGGTVHFDYCSFVERSEVWEGYSSSIFPFLQDWRKFWQFWVCCGSISFIELFIPVLWKISWVISQGSKEVIQEHGIFFHFFESLSVSLTKVS